MSRTVAGNSRYLAPYRFFAMLADARNDNPDEQNSFTLAESTLERYAGKDHELRAALLREFPHFSVFSELSKRRKQQSQVDATRNAEDVVRVMHMSRAEDWLSKNGRFLRHFNCVNDGLTCNVLEESELAGEDWVRSDQVVLNDELLFDFDHHAKRLVVTYLDKDELGKDFERFRDHCRQKSRRENSFEYLMNQHPERFMNPAAGI